MEKKSLSQFIQEKREKLGLTPSGLAKKCNLETSVIEEIEAWKALGPNGQEVAALIEKAKTITPEQAEQALCHRHHAMVRVSPGGEGVGRLLRDDVQPGLGNPRPERQLLDHAVQGRDVMRGDFLRTVHGQDDPVRKPVAAHVHD